MIHIKIKRYAKIAAIGLHLFIWINKSTLLTVKGETKQGRGLYAVELESDNLIIYN